VGIGATGPINRESGRIQNPFTLPTWDDVPVVDVLRAELGVPVVMENDAHAAALGEYWRGAGQGIRHMIYLTVGTGVGGGLILGGKLHTGAGGIAGEVGHLPVDLNGPECYCGGRGCIEAIASAPALIRQVVEHPDLPRSAILALAGGDHGAISAKIIADAARQGDAAAQSILERAGTALGLGLCGLIVVLAPERIVMGGGVMGSFDLLHPIIARTVQRISGYVPVPPIVPAALGLNAGVTGAVRALIERALIDRTDIS
jgi:glucokinase